MFIIKPPRVSISSFKSSFLIDDKRSSIKSIVILASKTMDPSCIFSNRHSVDRSCSSSISPTNSSTKSSIVTRPSIPPYSSTTSAKCLLLTLISYKRSNKLMEGDTNMGFLNSDFISFFSCKNKFAKTSFI